MMRPGCAHAESADQLPRHLPGAFPNVTYKSRKAQVAFSPTTMSSDTKGEYLPLPLNNGAPERKTSRIGRYAACLLVPCALVWAASSFDTPAKHLHSLQKACGLVEPKSAAALCPQATAAYPVKHAALWEDLHAKIGTDAFKTNAIDWLAGAVKVP